MRKKVLGLAFIVGLLFSSVAGLLADYATANPTVSLPQITIKSDGNLEPETEFIERNGNTYTLTENITRKYAIVVQCSNIMFDGAGYSIVGSLSYGGFSNIGLSLEGVRNVTVKNLAVMGFTGYAGISLSRCSECLILNVNTTWILDLGDSHFIRISDSYIGDTLSLGVNNQVTRSNIETINLSNNSSVTENNITTIIMFESCSFNTIFSNNLDGKDNFIGSSETNFWDNGSVGNYWSDYTGVDSNGDGIGDTPYVVDAPYNIDNYPLMDPFTIQESQPSPTPSQGPQLGPKEETSVPLTLRAGVSAVSIAIAGVAGCLFYYHKKHRC